MTKVSADPISVGRRPVTAVILGAGHRAREYASYSRLAPEELRIVGIADLNPLRRDMIAKEYSLPPEACFESADKLAATPKIADAVINGTMDDQHVPTSLPLLAAGYHILLEKPFATGEEEMNELVAMAEKHNRKVMICHVLRYAPFYAEIKKRLLAGEVGEIINIQTVEHVSYHHMAVGYVRGKWNRKDQCKATVLLAKCCHDLDLIVWMKSGVAPRRVASYGSNMSFRPEKAPPGAGTRCMTDCRIEPQCDYSARKHYIDFPERWGPYVWASIEHIQQPTIADMEASLKGDNPHGRCVWRCDNDQEDHQSVLIEFADGCTATHNMVCGVARPMRSIHILGTRGEIQGVFEDSRFVIRHIDARPGHEYSEQPVDVTVNGDMHGAFGGHGGGDMRLVADFVRMVRGEETSISCTRLEDSIHGHQIAFAACRAMKERYGVEIGS